MISGPTQQDRELQVKPLKKGPSDVWLIGSSRFKLKETYSSGSASEPFTASVCIYIYIYIPLWSRLSHPSMESPCCVHSGGGVRLSKPFEEENWTQWLRGYSDWTQTMYVRCEFHTGVTTLEDCKASAPTFAPAWDRTRAALNIYPVVAAYVLLASAVCRLLHSSLINNE